MFELDRIKTKNLWNQRIKLTCSTTKKSASKWAEKHQDEYDYPLLVDLHYKDGWVVYHMHPHLVDTSLPIAQMNGDGVAALSLTHDKEIRIRYVDEEDKLIYQILNAEGYIYQTALVAVLYESHPDSTSMEPCFYTIDAEEDDEPYYIKDFMRINYPN